MPNEPRPARIRRTNPSAKAFNAVYLRALRPSLSDREVRQSMRANRAAQDVCQESVTREEKSIANWNAAACRRKTWLWHFAAQFNTERLSGQGRFTNLGPATIIDEKQD